MIKNYCIDTNVMIHDPHFLEKFDDNQIIIPITCIEELDNLKKRDGMVGYHARLAARNINEMRKRGNLSEGITMPNGGKLRIEMNHMDFSHLPDGMDHNKNDNKILAITKSLALETKDRETILVSKDICMSIKGEALGLKVQDYQNDKVLVDEIYQGYSDIHLPSSDIDQIYNGGLRMDDESAMPNQFYHVHSTDDSTHQILARYDGEKLQPLKYANDVAWGLKPINREQKMAFELLMDPNVHFVSICGGAGSGKTILSTAVALQKVVESGAYNKIVFVRPVVSAGNDIGFLPGTEEEKLRPWMGSFYDSIENLMDQKPSHKSTSHGEKPSHVFVDDMIDYWRSQGLIETKTLTYMRGRTFNRSIVLVDEAQEITPHLAKLMLTRAGFNSKFVFIGDPSDNQIDNTLVDSKSNGLVYTVEKMKHFTITGHITLDQVERSPLAQLAEKHM